MRATRRLAALEERERERDLLAEAERFAERYGFDADTALRELHEMSVLIERWGLDGALRLKARKLNVTEDVLMAEYERVAAEWEADE